ncbi:MAG: amidohydrolase family protein [Bacteroidales bacterium]|jgi:dihydroorotase|nr:amidohydrolase family protein [Bacteroidales bacterium]
MKGLFLYDAFIITGERKAKGALSVEGEIIDGIWFCGDGDTILFDGKTMEYASFIEAYKQKFGQKEAFDLHGDILIAGGIDTHVHFREPGMSYKADIASESKAALLGGTTSFVDMPNTLPPTLTPEALKEKLDIASQSSLINYGFNIGASNDNYEIIKSMSSSMAREFGGIKIFMGSSTGNMLVDEDSTLRQLFGILDKPVLIHSEDENIIRENLQKAKKKYGDDIPFYEHSLIRSREACIKSTQKALEMAVEYGTRLHVLHISTAEEVRLIREAKNANPGITAETSINYLRFCDKDYEKKGYLIKCNPSIKTEKDREALIEGLCNGVIDTIGSDHAPHLLFEKQKKYPYSPSGIPSIQQTISVIFALARKYSIPLTRIVSSISERPADIFGIKARGYLKKGYFADMTIIRPDTDFIVGGNEKLSGSEGISYKCGWTPYEGEKLSDAIKAVFVNGRQSTETATLLSETSYGKKLVFSNSKPD